LTTFEKAVRPSFNLRTEVACLAFSSHFPPNPKVDPKTTAAAKGALLHRQRNDISNTH